MCQSGVTEVGVGVSMTLPGIVSGALASGFRPGTQGGRTGGDFGRGRVSGAGRGVLTWQGAAPAWGRV